MPDRVQSETASEILQRVQDRQRGPFEMGVLGDDPGGALGAPRLVTRHGFQPSLFLF